MSWSQEPVATPLRVDAEVVQNRSEGGANLRLVARIENWPGFAPGQFLMLSPGARSAVERSDPLLPRPMAIYRAQLRDGGAEVEILYKISGRGTALLAEARPGQFVRVVGPLGRAFPPPAPGEQVVIVGGGTGIASLYDLAARCRAAGGGNPVTLLLGARTAEDLMGRDDFAQLDAALHIATEDGSEGARGVVTDLLDEALAQRGPVRAYACGPTAMMRRTAEIAALRSRECIASLENVMACGFGVCLGCAAPLVSGDYALVCRDGPMFDATRIAWQALP
jgi:dihydroorotate dehydrogenase electron transfer subunit